MTNENSKRTIGKQTATPKRKNMKARVAGMGEHAVNPSATKSGPGRYHAEGHSKASPIKDKGAPRGFVLHSASVAKRNRRERIKSLGGIRQFKRWERLHAEA